MEVIGGSNLLIHETSDSVRGIALELSSDGIPGLDQARTIPKIMNDSEAEAAAAIYSHMKTKSITQNI
jgi:hypothetical protein